MFKNLGFERLRITSPRLYHTKVKQNNFKKTGGYDLPPPPPPWGVGMDLAESNCRANLSIPGHRKKVKKKHLKIDDLQNLGHCMYMENEMTVLKINKFKSVALVSVTYRLANGEVRVASGKTESEAMANMTTEATKVLDFAPLAKRSNSGSYFRNNNGTMVEV